MVSDLNVELNIKGLNDLQDDYKSSNNIKTYEQQNKSNYCDVNLVVPTINICKKDLNNRVRYVAEDIRLVGCESRLKKSTYPIRLYVNHDEIPMDNEWGWINLFKLFCDYCVVQDFGRFLELGNTKRLMGICIASSREDLLTNVEWHKESKVVDLYGIWFNLNRRGIDIATAIFRISDFMHFKYIALEFKKYDNSEF